MPLSRSAALARIGGATLIALMAGYAIGDRYDPAYGFIAFAAVAAALASVALFAVVEPAPIICTGIVLTIFSGQFNQLGSPVGLDRVVLATGVASVLVRELRSEHSMLTTGRIHVCLALIAAYALGSAAWADTLTSNGPFFSLLDNLGIIPFLLFWVAPAAFPTERERRMLLGTLVVLGAYLGLTAIAETIGPSALVFPSYILDQSVGIHWGRARGPFVEAAANGDALLVCATAAAIALARWRHKVLPVITLGACVLGIIFTLTRQIWLAAAVGVVTTMILRRELRPLLVPTVLAAGATVLVVFAAVPGFSDRAESRLDSQLPVWDRLNSNSAAIRMADARPLFGFGWATFPEHREFYRQAANRPLTVVERPHNVFLAYAAELGVLATLAWIGCIVAAVIDGMRRRGPPDLVDWRTGFIAVGCGWLAVTNFTPATYSFAHATFWLWLGVLRSRE